MSYYAIDRTNELAHHGILGMKWGVRRYQNEDGSLTSAGRIRYYGAGGDRKGYYREIGAAKRYKDVMRYHTKRSAFKGNPIDTIKNGPGYLKWIKQDPKNRIGQRAKYEKELAVKELGGNKGYADAKYAYEHKRLAKYINRDGSLTTAGKLKYWDTNKARGNARMQRDIERDKNSLTTTEKMAKKASDKRKGTLARIAGRYVTPAAAAAIIGRQKDPTKYGRKALRDTTKYAGRIGLNLATGNLVGATINSHKLLTSQARAVRKTAGRVAGNAIRGTAAAAILGSKYNPKGIAKTTVKGTPGAIRQIKRDARGLGPEGSLNKAARAEGAALNTVKKAAQYSYNTNKRAVQNVADTVTGKKKKKRS